jgi:hypothetical protein
MDHAQALDAFHARQGERGRHGGGGSRDPDRVRLRVEGFPTVPPGPFILAGAAALVAWGPWRWTVAVAVLAPLLSLVLGTMSTVLHWGTTAPLSHPGETAGFVGAVLQFVGLLVALGAGIDEASTRGR